MTAFTAEPLRPVNHVLVDFENVQEVDFSVIGQKTVLFTLLMGSAQKRVASDLLEKLVEHAASVQVVRLTSGGKNALDFALAYHVGRAVVTHPGCHVHIVSKDKGFDPLVEHLRGRGMNVRRHSDFSTMTFGLPKKTSGDLPGEPYARALEHLRKNATNRPKRLKTLKNQLAALNGSIHGKDVDGVVARLIEEKKIEVGEKEAVVYRLAGLVAGNGAGGAVPKK